MGYSLLILLCTPSVGDEVVARLRAFDTRDLAGIMLADTEKWRRPLNTIRELDIQGI